MSGMDRDSRLFAVGSRAAEGRGNDEFYCCSAAPVPVAGRSDGPLLNAACFEEFMRLRQVEHMTLVGAARALGKSPSLFSGRDCLFKRYHRGGLAELAQSRRDGTANGSDLTLRIVAWVGSFRRRSFSTIPQTAAAARWPRLSGAQPRCRSFPEDGTGTRPRAFWRD